MTLTLFDIDYRVRSIPFGAVWFALPAAVNESFIAASSASFDSAKWNGIVFAHVIRHFASPDFGKQHYEQTITG